ncbi:hypothetical protein COMA2_40268 [Candidatus Nitrospira nitrificans]|uniref:Uncharacterized protein n=1 Tax=Candidatus Nitrospira nitrificans TaxID=1742973 RepID=A0A0S4LKY6_9BACT|nr:hypothetical protein COMA2_40268 [Candidatus Nitrospira nitrificans]
MTFADGMGSIFNLKSMGPIGCLVDGQAFAFGTDYHLKVSAEEFVKRLIDRGFCGHRLSKPWDWRCNL